MRSQIDYQLKRYSEYFLFNKTDGSLYKNDSQNSNHKDCAKATKWRLMSFFFSEIQLDLCSKGIEIGNSLYEFLYHKLLINERASNLYC